MRTIFFNSQMRTLCCFILALMMIMLGLSGVFVQMMRRSYDFTTCTSTPPVCFFHRATMGIGPQQTYRIRQHVSP
jgi:hypothetical protein